METWIELSNTEKSIDHFKLGPLNFTMEPGTITALVGSNGSGKSTLLKLMMNLVKPDSGTITLFNKDVVKLDESWKKHVAYQPQTPIGYSPFTGEDLKSLISEWYPNWDDVFFKRIVKELDVSLKIRFDKMSQGAQQKLVLALTLARNTKLLLLDEPTSFLDIPSKKVLIDLLIEWMEQDVRSIILASHQAEDINRLADYITVMKKGNLIGTVEKEELIESYQRYWLEQMPSSPIPGEVKREDHTIVSNETSLTEKFFNENKISWQQTAIELDEIISILLT